MGTRHTLIFILCFSLLALADPDERSGLPAADSQQTVKIEELGGAPEVLGQTSLQIRLRNGVQYELPNYPMTDEQRAVFDALSPEDREQFFKHRKEYLGVLAKVLDLGRVPAGLVSSSKVAIINMLRRTWTGAAEPVAGAPQSPGFRERGRQMVESLLRAADSQLWNQAPLIAKSNEVGLTFEIGGGGGLAAGRVGLYGTTAFALGINYDRSARAVTIELYQDVETLRRAIPFTAVAALYGAMTGNTISHDWNRPAKVQKGESISGPGPLIGSITPSALRVGIGRGIGIAPPFLGDLSVVHTNLYRLPWLRIGISPVWPGWIRVQSGLGPALGATLYTAGQVPRVMGGAIARSCSAILRFLSTPQEGTDARWFGY